MAPSPDATPARRSGPLPGVLSATLGRALSPLYRFEINRRNRAYDRGVGVTRLDRPVISVGNLSVGGTGKTPMVKLVVSHLIDVGMHPAIAMRGYKGMDSSEGSAFTSDEAIEYQQTLIPWSDGTHVPIVAQPDRTDGLRVLFATHVGSRVDCVVLDDGFQHRKLDRDCDIVLIDATRSPWEDQLLPQGWLREPIQSLARAHAVVITHAESVHASVLQDLKGRLKALTPRAVLAVAEHGWSGLVEAGTAGDAGREVSWLRGRRAVVVCAIGNPRPFVQAARAATGSESPAIALPDHDSYGPAAMRRVQEAIERAHADLVLTTEKDWAKLAARQTAAWGVPVVRPRLRMMLREGREELESLLTNTVSSARRR